MSFTFRPSIGKVSGLFSLYWMIERKLLAAGQSPMDFDDATSGNFWLKLFDKSDFPPRWQCGNWTDMHGWLHITSDLAIWGAYLAIPIVLFYLLRRRTDLPFPGVLWLFGAFFVASGFTHLLEAAMFWWPAYRAMGVAKAVTAIVSWATVFALIPAVPRILTLETPESRQLAAIVKSSSDAIVSKDIHRRISSWNGAAEHLYGYTAAEAIGQPLDILIPPERRQQWNQIWEDILQGRQPEPLETERLHKNGTRLHVSVTISPLRDSSGRVVGASAISHDVSQKKREEERLRLMIEASPAGTVMINQEGVIVQMNSRAEELFGYLREELIGVSVEALVPESGARHHPRLRSEFLQDPQPRPMGAGRDLFALRKDGTEIPVEIGLSPIETPEGTLVVAAIMDISERKKAEDVIRKRTAELERSNKELDQFAYAASHDLKAPLRAIDHLSRFLAEDLEDKLTPSTREELELLRSRVRRMDLLLDGLLEYSRVGRTGSELSQVNVTALVEGSFALMEEPGFQLEISTPLPTFLTVEVPLEQVFRNLIGNAIKHHKRSQGKVEISCRDRGEVFEFRVTDDGPGINPEYHEQIFEMFRTLKPRDELEGTGLGLSLCKKTVEFYGGKIWVVRSEPNKGTTIGFTWPKEMDL